MTYFPLCLYYSLREIIRLFAKDKKLEVLIKKYCENYFNEFAGGTQGRIATAQDDNKFFYGTSSVFAISKNENYSKLYSRLIKDLNNYNKYDFFFEKIENINQFNIFENFFSGTKIFIKNIDLYNNEKTRINLNDILVHSASSYILENTNNEIIFFNGDSLNDVIKFNLNKTYNNINRISLEIKLEKLKLSNNSVCRNFYEN